VDRRARLVLHFGGHATGYFPVRRCGLPTSEVPKKHVEAKQKSPEKYVAKTTVVKLGIYTRDRRIKTISWSRALLVPGECHASLRNMGMIIALLALQLALCEQVLQR
jgi:hypothetical protein